MYRGFGYGYGGGGIGMLLFGVLVFSAVVFLVVWAVRMASGHHAPGGTVPPSQVTGHEEAVAISKRRLASGEITAEQYSEIIRTLGS
jgi:uncharacterized membrane protein